MATKVWTDATMTFVSALGKAGSNWETVVQPAWVTSDSMNGASGTVVYTTAAAPTRVSLFAVFGLLDDDATVPPVITMTDIQIQFTYTIVTTAGTTEITDSVNPVSVPGGGASSAFDGHSDPTVYMGGTDRSTMFSAPVLWEFASTNTSTQESVSISAFTVTITYTTPVTPQVLSINPSSGSVNGGQAVTITGEGFTGAPGATVGGVALTSFLVVSDTSITGVTGAHASGSVDVVVTGVGTLTDGYTYFIPPSFRLPPLPSRTPMTQGGGKPQRGTRG